MLSFIVISNYFNCCLTSLSIRMLKYDIESKGVRDVPQVDQADLDLPSESDLQMAQVGSAASSLWYK